MAPSKKPVPPSKLPAPAAPHDDLPEIDCVGVARVKGGWVCVVVTVQGDKVVDSEVIGTPEAKALAVSRGKIEFVTRYILNPKAN